MPNIKSQKKRVLTNEKSRVENKAIRSEIRRAIKHAKHAKSEGAADAQTKITHAVCLIDKGLKKGILKDNKAAREKSRLMSA
ncbi:30S ribosomal protein S20 [Entomoplasma ellychniae]|uniref:Small ribosomal subunit protein bS20 n=1 Tax=Entomoplasma ellychniae TaxID=2114 RepID=A0A8E2QZ38_9MOLU|nr:30S ribosomal protein S20 [Entomoplasma ellychniae]PPE04525.1 30S ribosomal protein S20 [Entomoplasma ellychniae]